jgi:hypothetical protein
MARAAAVNIFVAIRQLLKWRISGEGDVVGIGNKLVERDIDLPEVLFLVNLIYTEPWSSELPQMALQKSPIRNRIEVKCCDCNYGYYGGQSNGPCVKRQLIHAEAQIAGEMSPK